MAGFGCSPRPIIFEVSICRKRAHVKLKDDVDAIGEGCYASLTMLRYRGYEPLNIKPFHAAYLLYEAKKFSESVSSVGPKTRMKFHFPMSQKAGLTVLS